MRHSSCSADDISCDHVRHCTCIHEAHADNCTRIQKFNEFRSPGNAGSLLSACKEASEEVWNSIEGSIYVAYAYLPVRNQDKASTLDPDAARTLANNKYLEVYIDYRSQHPTCVWKTTLMARGPENMLLQKLKLQLLHKQGATNIIYNQNRALKSLHLLPSPTCKHAQIKQDRMNAVQANIISFLVESANDNS